jgi:O-antigen ligase
MRFGLLAVVLAAACVFGGASRSGFFGDIAVQLLAIPLLVVGARDWLVRMAKHERWRTEYLFLNFACIASILLIFFQLTPWSSGIVEIMESSRPHLLSGHNSATSSVALSGIVVAPASSWAAVASAIPFFAVFFATSSLGQEDRARLAMIVVALGGVSLLMGFLQVSQGHESGLRLYTNTNPSEAVGFFANRNHFSAFLYVTLVLTAVLLVVFDRMPIPRPMLNSRHVFCLVLAGMLLIAILSGIALARSRAGMALGLAATVGMLALHWPRERTSGRNVGNRSTSTRQLLTAAMAFGVIFAIQFGMQRAMSRFEADPFSDLRTALSPATIALALENLPLGTGLGTFEQTYAVSEADTNLFSGYANRAHNDWAEFLLETGLPGAVAAGLFLIWLTIRTIAVWKGPPHSGDIVILKKGASLIIVLLLIHSTVDYPLRTTALSSIFAFAAALLVPEFRRYAACQPVLK